MKQGKHSTRDVQRVLRGGSWNNNGRNVRSAYRNHNLPDNRNNNLGLRLSLARQLIGIHLSTRSLSCFVLAQISTNKKQGEQWISNISSCYVNVCCFAALINNRVG